MLRYWLLVLETLDKALAKHYGWNCFKAGQRPVIEAILSGKDAIAVLPTGGGKSLCYQLPALVRDGLVVVVSPLVSIMEDQVMQLNKKGILAGCIHSSLTLPRRNSLMHLLKEDKFRLLYLAPERLKSRSIRQLLNEKTNNK